MPEIVDLHAALARLNADALGRFDPGTAVDGMKKLTERLVRQRMQRKDRPASPTLVERQEAAVRRFFNGKRALDFRMLRYACLGSTHYIAKDRRVLLADQRALDALLAGVAAYAGEPRRFRRLYDGLLRAYLAVDRRADWFGSDAAAQGNERLRAFLEARFDSVRKSEPAPEWVGTLASFPEILSSVPGRRFAQGLLADDPRELDEACRSLRLTGTSWLALAAIRSATAAAVASPDRAFVAHIATLLIVAGEERFAPLRDEVYAALVTRYAAMPDRPVHPDLRDELVAAWKNPWLEQNNSAWGRVSPEARKMVAGWLKREFIRQFFEVLSEDKGQDRSRFEFWSRYHERMHDVYIALGSAAYKSHRPDLVKLRKALDGRLLKLNASPDTINAFIMFMGNDVIVEFSQYGNAAFRYRCADAPIDGAAGQIAIGQLRRAPPGIRMIHAGVRGLTWQQRFARELGFDASAIPERRPPHAPVTSQHTGSNPRPMPPTMQPSLADIGAFAWKHRLRWENHRPKGGNVWVYAGEDDPEISSQLKAWGFAYRHGKGWWRA